MKNSKLSVFIYILLAASLIFSSMQTVYAADKVQIDILYLDHGPMRPTVAVLKDLLRDYKGKVKVTWYNGDHPSGKLFMEQEGIVGHIPLLIMLDGRADFTVAERELRFQGFPVGASPFMNMEGNWTMDDLRRILNEKTGQKPKE